MKRVDRDGKDFATQLREASLVLTNGISPIPSVLPKARREGLTRRHEATKG